MLGVRPPFFPGILLLRKPPETQGKRLVIEKNGKSPPRHIYIYRQYGLYMYLFSSEAQVGGRSRQPADTLGIPKLVEVGVDV